MGVYVIAPVYLLESTPPKVSSPLAVDVDVVGLKDMATISEEIFFCKRRLSLTVGISV